MNEVVKTNLSAMYHQLEKADKFFNDFKISYYEKYLDYNNLDCNIVETIEKLKNKDVEYYEEPPLKYEKIDIDKYKSVVKDVNYYIATLNEIRSLWEEIQEFYRKICNIDCDNNDMETIYEKMSIESIIASNIKCIEDNEFIYPILYKYVYHNAIGV